MAETPTTRPELIALINERWDVLQSLVGGIADADMERPLGDGWSAKVHVAHIAAWESSLLALLRSGNRPEAMGISAELWADHDTDAINGFIAERSAKQSLADVRADSASTHSEVMAQLDSMSQADLERPYSHYQPDDSEKNANPVGGWVHGNTWDHYNEHIGWLEAGLRA